MAYFGLGSLVLALVVLALGMAGVVRGAAALINVLLFASLASIAASLLLPRLRRHHSHHRHT
jgi:hypothetical protein